MNKICKQCKIEKDVLDFRHQSRINIIYISLVCKKCDFENSKVRHLKFRENNRQNLRSLNKKYYAENKAEIKERQKYKKPEWDKKYYLKNKKKILKKQQIKCKKRYNSDPNFRIRKCISKSISRHLNLSNSSKGGKSCLNYLPYSILELKIHLESLFEPWMNNNNYGLYMKKNWNDDDTTTWTWQIDHIVPHSEFKYTSMEDDAFKKCWSLDNLRPLSAKQNQFDGVNRIRHVGRL